MVGFYWDDKRNIVILSDGTGNSQSLPFKTNVWRIYKYLDLTTNEQIARYDDGVGSASNIISRYLGGVFGFGLKRNVIDLYIFLSRNYQDNNNLYFFGFSRGAFTIRLLIGLISRRGLLENSHDWDDYKLRQLATRQYNDYRRETLTTRVPLPTLIARLVRTGFLWFFPPKENCTRPVAGIKFVGLWDTVDAYGIPIEELRSGIDRWIFPMSFRSKELWGGVQRACHALALDDARATFHPILWEEEEESGSSDQKASPGQERIVQLWFAGAHADVGGGYPDDRLAYVPLLWIMREAKEHGLKFTDCALKEVEHYAWKKAPVHNSRKGRAAYYRYKPRMALRSYGASVEEKKVRIHLSVHERLIDTLLDYAPLSIPSYSHDVYDFNKEKRATLSRGGASRKVDTTFVLDRIWWRRVSYFAILFLTLGFLASPLFMLEDRDIPYLGTLPGFADFERYVSGLVSFSVDFLGWFLPVFAKPWIEAVKTAPVLSIISIAILIALWYGNYRLDARIAQQSVAAWNTAASPGRNFFNRAALSIARFLRTNCHSTCMYQFAAKEFIPGVFALLSVVVVLYAFLFTINRSLFDLDEARGTFCGPSASNGAAQFENLIVIAASNPCGDTGLDLAAGQSYLILAKAPPTARSSFQWVWLPLRRWLRYEWSNVIAEVVYVDSSGKRTGERLPTIVNPEGGTQVRPKSKGRLYVYRNNAVIAPSLAWLPRWLAGSEQPFYEAADGEIRLKVKDVMPNDASLADIP
jgi:uncharacterized protein (DUF2235 family)